MAGSIQAVDLIVGEKKPLYAKFTSATNIQIIDASGGQTDPKIKIFAEIDSSVTLASTTCTDWDTGAARSVSAMHLWDTASVDPGGYLALFTVYVQGTDGNIRIEKTHVAINVIAEESDSVQTDLSTDTGKVRFYLADRDRTSPIWNDTEIAFALTESDDNVILAAVLLLESELTEQARSASIIRLGVFGNNPFTAYQAMKERIAQLRARAGASSAYVLGNERLFTPQYAGSDTIGTMEDW